MPELPEVETVRRGLESLTLDCPITGGEVLYPKTIALPNDPDWFLAGVVGQSLQAWERRGKYLIGILKDQSWLVVHLRMTGQLFWVDQSTPVAKHTRVRLFCAGGQELRFVDQRTFGQMWWLERPEQLAELMPTLATLGPEPLSPAFTTNSLTQALKSRHRPIKSLLLDQALIAGLGNIYADEALFLGRIYPLTPAAALTPSQIQQLHQAIIRVLETSLAAGGTTFNTFTSVEGINGNYGGQAWVYGRKGEPCRECHTPIERIKLSGRSTHFCPQCQPHRPTPSKL